VIEFWEKFSPIIVEWRRRYNAPQIYVGYEFLVDEMRRIRESRSEPTYIERSKLLSKTLTP